jgi:hypothetical protein
VLAPVDIDDTADDVNGNGTTEEDDWEAVVVINSEDINVDDGGIDEDAAMKEVKVLDKIDGAMLVTLEPTLLFTVDIEENTAPPLTIPISLADHWVVLDGRFP